MKNYGVITEISKDKAKIKVVRDSACGDNCANCGGCDFKNHFTEADINTDFLYTPSVGDNVEISVSDKTFYLYSILGYGIFTLFLAIGCVVGYMTTKSEDASVLGAFSGLFIAFLLVKLLFRNKKTQYKIEKVGK